MTPLSSIALLLAARAAAVAAAVPSLEQLAPRALPELRLQSLPQVQNFVGAVGLRHDLVSLGTMALTPFNGNFQNSTLFIDGAPAVSASSRYGVCTGSRAGTAGVIGVVNEVRLPFEQHAVLQRWLLAPGDGLAHALSANFDGPFFRACDLAPGQGACGWGTSFPIDRASFASSVDADSGIMLSVDGVTGVAVASRLWFQGTSGGVVASVVTSNQTFDIVGSFADTSGGVGSVALQQAMAVGRNASEALAALAPLASDAGFAAAFADACDSWEARWQMAFQVPTKDGGAGSHFGGNLPVLSSNMPEIDRLYYWAALAFISLERTNLRSGPRQFVISQGPSNSLDGSAGMGGSGEFVWDLSFAATAMSLLEPEAVRAQAAFVMNATQSLQVPPAVVPQCWDAFPAFNEPNSLSLGSYRFDYYSAFLHVMTFVSINNASDWLLAPLTPPAAATGVDFLLAMARSREGYPQSTVSPWLTDYGANKRDYLEVVSTYTSVVPALQFGSVAMASAAALLLEQVGLNQSESGGALVRALRANASAIAEAALAHLWRDEDAGAWRCLYADGNSTAVRSVTDYVYIAQALGLMARDEALAASLPPNVVNASLAFFASELLSQGTQWVRALSLQDPLCANVMSANASLEDLMVMRADWGCFGSYGGIPGFACESSVHLTQTFQGLVDSLAQIAPVALTAAPSQAIALGTPTYYALHFNGGRAAADVPEPPFSCAFPEFFDEGGDWPLFWPDTERYVQNAEASFVDVVVRTLFGWRPDWVTPAAAPRSAAAAAAIDAALYLPTTGRGSFQGTLSLLRTPLGYINVTAGPSGLSWTWA